MERKKITLKLTDVRLHATTSQPTTNIVKVLKKAGKTGAKPPRIFTPLPNSGQPGGLVFDPVKGVGIPLSSLIPQEILKKAATDGLDVEIELPDGNVIVFDLAPDVAEKVKKTEKKERAELIHTSRKHDKRYSEK